jgi:hypothetical protein
MTVFERLSAVIRPDLAAAAVRFPTPATAAVLATFVMVMAIEGRIPFGGERFERMLYGAAVAFTAGVALRIWLEGRDRRNELAAGQLAALGLGVAAAFSLYSLWLTPALLLASLALFAAAAPGFPRAGTLVRFWLFNVRSAFAAVLGAVGAAAFAVGFWAVLATLQSLFDVRVSWRLVSHAAAVGFVLVLPLYWLALQPRVHELGDEEATPDLLLRAVAALTDFIFLPLIIVYAVILHLYAAKIAVVATLPRGQLGWMASTFLGLGYVAYVLALPRRGLLPGIRSFFRRLWPLATAVPVGLLVLALYQRVQAYGMTEGRYLVAVVALVAGLLILAWRPGRQLDDRLVPAIAGGVLLIGAIGPFSAGATTVHSQAARFIAVLDAAGDLSGGRLVEDGSTRVSAEKRKDLLSIVVLLERRRALHLLAPAVGTELAAKPHDLRRRFALDRPSLSQPAVGTSVRIDGDVLLGPFYVRLPGATPVRFRVPDGPEFSLAVEGMRLVLSSPEGTFTFDLPTDFNQAARPEAPQPEVIYANDPRAVLIVRSARSGVSSGARRLEWVNAQILLRPAAP